MEVWLVLAVLVLVVIVLVMLIRRSGRSDTPRVSEELYKVPPPGATPQPALTDPAQFGQVIPGAVTPAAAGSPDEFAAATGFGVGGPQHASGPPPPADLEARSQPPRTDPSEETSQPVSPVSPAAASAAATNESPGFPEVSGLGVASGAASGWAQTSPQSHVGSIDDKVPAPAYASSDMTDGERSSPPTGVVMLGAGVFIALIAFWRRRSRRKTPLERLRGQAGEVAGRASKVASRAGARATALQDSLPDSIDARAGASGLALASALGLFAALRQLHKERSFNSRASDLEDRARDTAPDAHKLRDRLSRAWKSRASDLEEQARAAAPDAGRLRARLSRLWDSREDDREAVAAAARDKVEVLRSAAKERAADGIPPLAGLAAGLGLLVLAVFALRRSGRAEPDWSGAWVPDSAPARESATE